ncbi:MAG: hypothetical protein IPF99_36450 [Deltaproteobacteria bacterium]|nr:hypothetical protein [Deltaproteobacteria bacterium]
MRTLSVVASLCLLGCEDYEPPPIVSDASVADAGDAPVVDAPVLAVDAPEETDSGPPCPSALGTPSPRTGSPARGPMDDALRMNHLQAKGTHNSYHLRPAIVGPDWDYSQAPLDEQLQSQGVRALELDIRWDARCGRFRVFHLPILDPRSTCDLFTDCLGVVRRWSDAHPSHHPLFLQIEPKDAWDAPTTEQRMTAMETEILSVFLASWWSPPTRCAEPPPRCPRRSRRAAGPRSEPPGAGCSSSSTAATRCATSTPTAAATSRAVWPSSTPSQATPSRG